MCLFTILMIVLPILIIMIITILGIGGMAFLVVFGDIIVCAAIIIFIVKMIRKRRRP